VSVEIRRATAADVEAIRRVGLLTWPAAYLPFTNADHVMANLERWWSADAVRRSIGSGTTLVADDDGHVVATSTLGTWDGTPVVWKIYVVPERQGTGLGRTLLTATLDLVPPGQDVLIEFVRGNERARALYESLGFVPEREEPGEHGTTTCWYRRPAART
jgi:GNAT superfamily N-acetyltransferase